MSSIVRRFLSGSYTVVRSLSGSYVMGRYVPGPTTTLTVKGSMQATTARALKLEPEEGARIKQLWKFFTDQAIAPIGTSTLAKADTVTVDGETYKVLSQEKWQGFQGMTLSYFLAVLAREPEQ